MDNLKYAAIPTAPTAPTATPGEKWIGMTADARKSHCGIRSLKYADVQIIDAKADGQVIVALAKPMPASQRGTLLLDLEAQLKEMVDPAIVVWLESLGDKNSLRNLRGIEIKS